MVTRFVGVVAMLVAAAIGWSQPVFPNVYCDYLRVDKLKQLGLLVGLPDKLTDASIVAPEYSSAVITSVEVLPASLAARRRLDLAAQPGDYDLDHCLRMRDLYSLLDRIFRPALFNATQAADKAGKSVRSLERALSEGWDVERELSKLWATRAEALRKAPGIVDMPAYHWGADAVCSLANAGLLTGIEEIPKQGRGLDRRAQQAMNSAEIVARLREIDGMLCPGEPGSVPRLQDRWRVDAMAAGLMDLRFCSDAAIKGAVAAMTKTQQTRDFSFGLVFVCRIWFVLLYAPEDHQARQSKEQFELYHWPIQVRWNEKGPESVPSYDFPWYVSPSGRWAIDRFTYRVQGGLPGIDEMYEIHSKLPRRAWPER